VRSVGNGVGAMMGAREGRRVRMGAAIGAVGVVEEDTDGDDDTDGVVVVDGDNDTDGVVDGVVVAVVGDDDGDDDTDGDEDGVVDGGGVVGDNDGCLVLVGGIAEGLFDCVGIAVFCSDVGEFDGFSETIDDGDSLLLLPPLSLLLFS